MYIDLFCVHSYFINFNLIQKVSINLNFLTYGLQGGISVVMLIGFLFHPILCFVLTEHPSYNVPCSLLSHKKHFLEFFPVVPSVAFKIEIFNRLKSLSLIHLKIPEMLKHKVVYKYKCTEDNCQASYIRYTTNAFVLNLIS